LKIQKSFADTRTHPLDSTISPNYMEMFKAPINLHIQSFSYMRTEENEKASAKETRKEEGRRTEKKYIFDNNKQKKRVFSQIQQQKGEHDVGKHICEGELFEL
jgi:hypothetical protein